MFPNTPELPVEGGNSWSTYLFQPGRKISVINDNLVLLPLNMRNFIFIEVLCKLIDYKTYYTSFKLFKFKLNVANILNNKHGNDFTKNDTSYSRNDMKLK